MTNTPTKKPVQPVVRIAKGTTETTGYISGGSLYTFNPFTGSADFKILKLQCDPPVDSKGGKFTMTIIAPTGGDNTTLNAIKSNIQEGNQIDIQLGKSSSGLTKVFTGVIEAITVKEITPTYTQILLEGPDWGSNVLRNRIVQFYRSQRTTDGISLDPTDPYVTVFHLLYDMLSNTAFYPLYDITAVQQGIGFTGTPNTTTGIDLSNTYIDASIQSVRVAQLMANFEHLDDKLNELDSWCSAVHYVDPNGNFVMRPILPPTPNSTLGVVPGSWLFTDDASDTLISSWTSGNVGYISPEMSEYKYTLESYKRRMIGMGAQQEFIDGSQNPNLTPVSQETNSGSTTLDSTNWLAMQFTPQNPNGTKIAIYVASVGVPTVDLSVLIIQDLNGKPNGQTLRSLAIPRTQITSSPGWQFINVGAQYLSTPYWIVLPPNPNYSVGNSFKWYKGGSTYTTSTSTDGLTWTNTTNTAGYMFRSYTGIPNIIPLPSVGVTASDKMLKEETYRQSFITNSQALVAYLNSISPMILNRKEIYTTRIYAPDNIPMPFASVVLRKTKTGLVYNNTTNPASWKYHIIGQLQYNFQTTPEDQTGVFWLDNVELTRFTSFP